MAVGKRGKCLIVPVKVDISHLSGRERKCLGHLIKASRAIEPIYWKQLSEHGLPVRNFVRQISRHAAPGKKPLFNDYAEYLDLNHGFFDELNGRKKFFPEFSERDVLQAISRAPKGARDGLRAGFESVRAPMFSTEEHASKAPGGTMYHPAITKEQIADILESEKPEHAKLKAQIAKVNTAVTIGKNGNLAAVPYEKLYADHLAEASRQLELAASHASGSLKKYLVSRAKALVSGDFRESDGNWVNAESNVNATIGPIETYIDQLAGLKAAYGATVYVSDPKTTAKLEKFKKAAQHLEDALPTREEYKNKKAVVPPIEAVQAVANIGDCGGISHPVASILPNDEEVRRNTGYRITLYLNTLEAKSRLEDDIYKKAVSQKSLSRFSEKELIDGQRANIVLHELGHAGGRLAPAKGVDAEKKLREYANIFSETKAYTLALRHATELAKTSAITEKECDASYYAYLATTIRRLNQSAHAGTLGSAHEKALATIYNFLKRRNAITVENGRLDLDIPKARQAVDELSSKLLEIQGEGSHAKAHALFTEYARMPDAETEGILKRIKLPPNVITPFPKLQL